MIQLFWALGLGAKIANRGISQVSFAAVAVRGSRSLDDSCQQERFFDTTHLFAALGEGGHNKGIDHQKSLEHGLMPKGKICRAQATDWKGGTGDTACSYPPLTDEVEGPCGN